MVNKKDKNVELYLMSIAIAYILLGLSVWVNMISDNAKFLFIAVSIILGIIMLIYGGCIYKKKKDKK